MDKIAKTLKERREELGLSTADISERTKLSLKHIEAMEEGNLDYFKDDLTYLQFYVRSYCNALSIDFNDVKGDFFQSIDDYTDAFTQAEIDKKEKLDEEIRNKASNFRLSEKLNDKSSEEVSTYKKPSKIKSSISSIFSKKKSDLPLILLIVIVLVAGAVVGFKLLSNNSNGTEAPKGEDIETLDKDKVKEDETPTGETTPEQTTPDESPDTTTPVEAQLSVTVDPQDPSMYYIKGYTEGQELVITTSFYKDCWTEFYYNSKMMSAPTAKVYATNSIAEMNAVATTNDTYLIVYSNPGSAKDVKVGDINIPIDQSLGLKRLTFVFVEGE